MKLRLHLTATIDVDVQHPTFLPLFENARAMEEVDDRTIMALEGYLTMLVAQEQRAGKQLQWAIAVTENICRVCGCTDDVACEGRVLMDRGGPLQRMRGEGGAGVNIWIVAWLPFMASPFDTPEAVLAPGVDAAQAIANVKSKLRFSPTDMIRAVSLNEYARNPRAWAR